MPLSPSLSPLALLSLIFMINFSSIVPDEKSLQKKRFEVYWGVPSEPCYLNGTPPLEPQKFGIRTNLKQKFHGSEVVVFYEDQLGLYPRTLAEQNPKTKKWRVKKVVNGGLPQKANLRAHLEKAAKDIVTEIPDPNFAGPAVIDYEHWRPHYSLNWESRIVYKMESTRDAMSKFPNISEKSARFIGEELFNAAAKKFMVATIRLGRKLRPHAAWGFYDFPLCNYDVGKSDTEEDVRGECRHKFRAYNDKLLWLFAESNTFYPPIYLYEPNTPGDKRPWQQRYVHAHVAESERITAKLRRRIPVLAFTKIEYNPYNETGDFYTEADLCNTLGYSGELAVQGLVVWSSSRAMTERCSAIAEYVQSTFGPFVQRTQEVQKSCSEKRCHDKGQCVLRKQQPPVECPKELQPDKYACICDPGYLGEYCDSIEKKIQ